MGKSRVAIKVQVFGTMSSDRVTLWLGWQDGATISSVEVTTTVSLVALN